MTSVAFTAFLIWMLVLVFSSDVTNAVSNKERTSRLQLRASSSGISNLEALCDNASKRLEELKIRLIAMDFDQTIVNIHTGGQWQGSSQELELHVRPEIRKLILACVKRGMKIVVVTFSQQTSLIAMVIQSLLPPGVEVPVRGGENFSDVVKGKKDQLVQASEDVFSLYHTRITPTETILIDDDPNNIQKALDDGYRAVVFEPDHVTGFLEKILSLN